MSDRRISSRARKQVDYSVSGEHDFEGDKDDEDFAVSSRGPAVKKLRTAKEKVTEKQKLTNPKQAPSNISNDKTSKERRSLDDRVFERDLELVMSLSKTASDPKGRHVEPVSVSSQVSTASNSVDAKVLQCTGNTADKELKSMQMESSFTEEEKEEGKEKEEEVASVKKSNLDLSNDDDHLSLSDDESSEKEDDDDGSDSSYSSDTSKGRLSKTKALGKRNAKAKPAKPTKSAKQTLEKSKNSNIIKTVNLASRSQKMVARSNLPKASGGHVSDRHSSYSSPTSGVLRIGLSRNVKVKPLHQLNSPASTSLKS